MMIISEPIVKLNAGRKEPIEGYVPKNYEKNNSGSNGLNNNY